MTHRLAYYSILKGLELVIMLTKLVSFCRLSCVCGWQLHEAVDQRGQKLLLRLGLRQLLGRQRQEHLSWRHRRLQLARRYRHSNLLKLFCV